MSTGMHSAGSVAGHIAQISMIGDLRVLLRKLIHGKYFDAPQSDD